jgi:orotidine-5'-phosphate decarboxylase
MPRSIVLVPGYGAQGGTAADAAANFDRDGLGAVVNASRSVMYAWRSERWKDAFDEAAFAAAARAECLRMRDELNAALKAAGKR